MANSEIKNLALSKKLFAITPSAPAVHRQTHSLAPALLRLLKPLGGWIIPVLILVVWQVAAQTGWLQSRLKPAKLL